MLFKLRHDPIYGKRRDERKRNAAYHQYLQDYRKEVDDVLVKYFSLDFFHDGEIKRIISTEDHRACTFEMECPNIWHKSKERYISCDYTVSFTGIEHISFEYIDRGKHKYISSPYSHLKPIRTFGYAEIHSLRDEIIVANQKHYSPTDLRSGYVEPFQSIIIYIYPYLLSISIIFNEIRCVPVDFATVYLLESGKEFVFPGHIE